MSEFDRRSDPQSSFPIRPSGLSPAPGKSSLMDPFVPGPSTVTPGKHTRAQHTQPLSAFRRPGDEVPSDWNAHVRPVPLPDPFVVHNIVPQEGCPLPPSSAWEHAPSHHGGAFPGALPGSPHVLLNQAVLDRRQDAWWSYRLAASHVMTVQTGVADEIARFRHVTPDDALSMGLLVPKAFQGNLAALAERQEVPHRGGTQVGQLFDATQQANLSDREQHAAHRVEADMLGLSRADTQLKAVLARVKAALNALAASKASLRAAVHAIDLGTAEMDAESAEAEIKALKEDSDEALQMAEFITNGPERLAGLLEKVTHPASACALVFSLLPNDKLEAAKAKLKAARSKMRNAKVAMLQEQLAAAQLAVSAAIEELTARRFEVQAAYLARRESYDDVGTKTQNPRLASLLAAIPVVEAVVARARIIVERTANVRPECTEQAALGYGIALQHKKEEAMMLPLVLGMLEGTHSHFQVLCDRWSTRLKSLLAIKEQLSGMEPSSSGDEAVP